jgi:hypothetical protein
MDGSTVSNTSVELGWTGLDADGGALVFMLELGSAAGHNLTRKLEKRNTTLELSDRMEYTWRVIASDGIDNVSSPYQKFTVRVNRRPVIHSVPVLEATPGKAYAYQVVATDPDSDQLRYFPADMPAGMGIEPRGRVLWVPSAGQAGKSFWVVLTVSDGELEQRQEFTINVAKAKPEAPLDPAGPPVWQAAGLAIILAAEIAVVWFLRWRG